MLSLIQQLPTVADLAQFGPLVGDARRRVSVLVHAAQPSFAYEKRIVERVILGRELVQAEAGQRFELNLIEFRLIVHEMLMEDLPRLIAKARHTTVLVARAEKLQQTFVRFQLARFVDTVQT